MAQAPAITLPASIPSIANIKNHITIDMGNTNYFHWKRLFLNFLKSHRMTCFVDGTVAPPAPTHQQYALWTQMDATVLGWISSTLFQNILEAFLNYNCETARSAWLILENHFLAHAGTTQMHLYRRFQNFSLVNCTMDEMLTQLHSLACQSAKLFLMKIL
ncbi:hypothetical protein LIER_39722 [Lithospermum erythrorhizon]|uniref:Retrotransposon Copia-like N-terminal domain-containing protein n=1 Tax=Lithospermum erythrorhizon TaxID=34254 RepID=A0AAV3QKQ8_LITER